METQQYPTKKLYALKVYGLNFMSIKAFCTR